MTLNDPRYQALSDVLTEIESATDKLEPIRRGLMHEGWVPKAHLIASLHTSIHATLRMFAREFTTIQEDLNESGRRRFAKYFASKHRDMPNDG
jgi:hypothetical protein